jgi:hypothetical protein
MENRIMNVNFKDVTVKIPSSRNITSQNKWKFAFLNQDLIQNIPIQFKTNITYLKIISFEDEDNGYLEAHFDNSWCVKKNGLIYNNPKWIKEFREKLEHLIKKPVTSSDINYSEQGMQTTNYVHMDINKKIINSLKSII